MTADGSHETEVVYAVAKCLRHTFATLAIHGLDPAMIQTLMVHSKITTTERYLHGRPLTELAERMDAIFSVAPTVSDQTVETVA